jgi:hypothetical protein
MRLKTRPLIVASMLLGAASGSMAVSLGRSSGAVLLGRPLDLSVQVALDSADAGAASCVEADVFYADERIPASRVLTSLERTAASPDARIRIRVARVVDEPVITLYVRAGCVQRTERRYVLLPDVATEQTPAPRPAEAPSRAAPETLAGTTAPVTARRPPGTEGGMPEARRSAAQGLPQTPRVARGAAAQPTGKSPARLRLEPIDLSVETFPQLRASTELLSLPAASPEQRAQAAALWKALSARPEDVMEAAAKVSAIEADVRGLQQETRKNQAALAEFSAALQSARQERYANGLVYGLLAALVFTLAGLAWFWHRQRSRHPVAAADQAWWRSKMPPDTGWHSELGPVASGYHTHDGHDVSRPAAFDKPAHSQPESGDHRKAERHRVARSRALPLSRRDQTDFGLSMPHTPRAAKAEELFDVQHQAEFFISIGKEDQAISILLDHIGDDVQSSALIYLDLFGLYHKLGRRDDYQDLAASFNTTFNARIPAFEAWTGTGPGLEAHASTLAQILAAWPRTAVLTFIESLIFHRPGQAGDAFEPEAFRELLFLYGIAREIVEADAPLLGAMLDFDLPDAESDTDPAASGGMGLPTAAGDALPVIEDPLATSGVVAAALDIDLGVLGGKTGAAEEALPPLSGGNLIDFEALTLGTPAHSSPSRTGRSGH